MGFLQSSCPKCGAKYNEKCDAWANGSPIRNCPKCGHEYLDRRWREPALQGFDTRSTDPKFYLKATFFMAAASVICWLLIFIMAKTKGSYPIKLAGCAVLTLVAAIACLVMYIRIKSGAEDTKNQAAMEASRQRLQNKEYVRKLMEYGYDVPEEYR